MLITIFGDIFRDHELSSWGKALWTLFLIVVPWLRRPRLPDRAVVR